MTNVAYAQQASDIVVANDNSKIEIDQELKALIPPLSAEEYAQLEENILANGCRDPLVLWGATIVDGHNRYEICTKHGLPFKREQMEFSDKAQARIWMRKNQLGRRNISDGWRYDLMEGIKEELAEIGRVNQAHGETAPGKTLLSETDKSVAIADSEITPFLKNDVPPTSQRPVPKHDTRKEVAKELGWSTGKVAQADYVKKHAPDAWEKVRAGETTINGAYEEIKKVEKKAEREALIQKQKDDIESGAVALPSGVYEVVVMDPPWNYGREYDPDTSRVANPYPEMTQAQLLEMDPPFAEDSVLFLWTTHQFIWDAKALMDKWGFTYKANLVWDKDRIGMGAWVRMQCEFCLVGIKGKPHWSNTKWRDIIREPRREHSRKPEVFYQMVEEITAGRRLDFFSREERNGWASFGNDKEKF